MMLHAYLGTVTFVLMLATKEICLCNIQTCFTWKISKNRLTLTCKVDDLHLSVFIDDPFGKVQADCVQPHPFVKCEPYYKNGSITQNSTTKETIFTVQGKIDKSINGNWTCRHGTHRDIAKVEVTVLNTLGGIGSGLNKENIRYDNNTVSLKDSTDNQCVYKVLLFSMIAYFGTMLVWVILWCKTGEYIKPLVDDIWQNCMCINSIPGLKTVSFITCSCLFLGICTLCGYFDDATCIFRIVLPIIGIVFASLSTPLFLNLAVEQRIVTVNSENAPGIIKISSTGKMLRGVIKI
ncbi:uncharacterized protein LOC127705817 isoform X2 [Mytilus californianus]|uniref:uncharacterized protein LOC127705817 isoform X2 n=1 Tax=Mytilus californianus TaxID=6549 RepID=UPI002245BA86|nr:uncharacterized protein LOC127705817 isoform X2 [Mytilus californianus]